MSYLDYGYNAFLIRSGLPRNPATGSLATRASYVGGSIPGSAVSTPLNATTNITFSSTDNDTAAWTTGVIRFSNGTDSGTVDAGNTGDITATTYVYWDRGQPNILQTTTEPTRVQGANRILLAIVEGGDADKKCKITPMIGAGLVVSNITADQIKAGVISADLLSVGSKTFTTTLSWTAAERDIATWSSGTVLLADATSYSITSGTTGNINSTTYVYLDTDISATELQTTTTASNAVGSNKILLSIITIGSLGAKCVIDVIQSTGTTISGDNITTGKVQSADGKTYFDLDNNRIQMTDDNDDITVVVGESNIPKKLSVYEEVSLSENVQVSII